jgi:hypothetical protein
MTTALFAAAFLLAALGRPVAVVAAAFLLGVALGCLVIVLGRRL